MDIPKEHLYNACASGPSFLESTATAAGSVVVPLASWCLAHSANVSW